MYIDPFLTFIGLFLMYAGLFCRSLFDVMALLCAGLFCTYIPTHTETYIPTQRDFCRSLFEVCGSLL